MADPRRATDLAKDALDSPNGVASIEGVTNKAFQPYEMEKAYAGLTPDYLSFRNTWYGQPHPVNLDLCYKAYREDPTVYGVINMLSNDIAGDGWTLVYVNDKSQTALNEIINRSQPNDDGEAEIAAVRAILDRSNFDAAIPDITKQLQIYGNFFFEAVREGSELGYVTDNAAVVGTAARTGTIVNRTGKALPSIDSPQEAAEFFVKEIASLDTEALEKAKEEGNLEKALEQFNDKINVAETPTRYGKIQMLYPLDAKTIQIDYDEHGETIKYVQRVLQRRVEFFPGDLIHLATGRIGNRPYGESNLLALLQTLMTKHQAEKYTYDFFKRAFMPRLIYIVNNMNEDLRQRFIANLRAITPQQDITITGDVKIEHPAPNHNDMQFSELLIYNKQNIYTALQVPAAVAGDATMGKGGGGGRSGTQALAEGTYYKRVKALKKQTADALNNGLFTFDNFGTNNVKFVWLEDNTKEELRRVQVMAQYSAIPYLTPNEVRAAGNLPKLESPDADTPIFEIQHAQQMKVADNKQFGPNDSRASVERRDNAEANNSESQRETKSEKAYGRGVPTPPLAGAPQGGDFDTRTSVNPNAQDGVPKRDYGYGATESRNPAPQSVRGSERTTGADYEQVKEAIDNPIGNSFDLNHDRHWPKDHPSLEEVMREGKKRRPTNFALSADEKKIKTKSP